MEGLFTVENLIALCTLTALEIVLGIDNIVFIAILTGRLDPSVQKKAQRLGLALAMIMRILLLLGVKWVVDLKEDWFTLLGQGFSGKDVILLGGGLFLIGKATYEIHHKVEGGFHEGLEKPSKPAGSMRSAIAQIILIDMVFSLDSVITAVGMAQSVAIMIVAVVIAVMIMMIFAGRVSHFVERYPSLKMLALAFLLLIGVMLVVEGWGKHMERGYIYFAMGFSLGVELLNLRAERRRKTEPA